MSKIKSRFYNRKVSGIFEKIHIVGKNISEKAWQAFFGRATTFNCLLKSKRNFSGDNCCDSKLDTYKRNTERLARDYGNAAVWQKCRFVCQFWEIKLSTETQSCKRLWIKYLMSAGAALFPLPKHTLKLQKFYAFFRSGNKRFLWETQKLPLLFFFQRSLTIEVIFLEKKTQRQTADLERLFSS